MKKVISLLLMILTLTIIFSLQPVKFKTNDDNRIYDHTDLNNTFKPVTESIYYSYDTLRSNFTLNIQYVKNEQKIIMIEDAIDLFNFSQDLSYSNDLLDHSTKVELASLNYALGADIDYSIMKSSRFMPIGYNVLGETLNFTGSFDGRGFEISNLYYESFRNYSFEDEVGAIYTFSQYFSMFNTNSGTIKNFGLINPIIALENEHPNLRYFAYLVGLNNGTLENVYVEDNRSFGQAGMQVLAIKTQVDTQKQAAAIVHTNNATFKNAYFTGQSVVHRNYLGAILEKPIYYLNNSGGSITNILYDNTLYGVGLINVPNFSGSNSGQPNDTAINIKNGTTSLLSNGWYFYQVEGYPKRYGLNFDNNAYQINNAIDFITFNKLTNSSKISANGKTYAEQDFVITNDINLDDVSRNSYKVLGREFSGSIKGVNANIQINNLHIDEGINIGAIYYLGLFSVLTGEVSDLTFFNALINPTFTNNFVNQTFKIGLIAGEVRKGKVSNLAINNNIDLSNPNFKLGSFVVGQVAGEASGIIEKIYINDTSKIDLRNQTYTSSDQLNKELYVGGIIGKTTTFKLVLYNILNKGNIYNLTANNLFFKEAGTSNIYIGGIIGYVNNQLSHRNSLGLLTNEGTITNRSNLSSNTINAYLGGVIGYSTGIMYEFNNTYGLFKNKGKFENINSHNNSDQFIAGILNSYHSEAVEFTQLFNSSKILIDHINITGSLLINHLSDAKLTVSQAVSQGEFEVRNIMKDFAAGIYTSKINSELDLRFVEVYANFKVDYTSSIDRESSYAGITLNENANFLNVKYGGNITFNNSNASQPIWISGITKVLSAGKKILNTSNEGNINITSTSSANLYVAGLVNRNLSGDLQNQDNSNMPKATMGVINSINRANIEIIQNGLGNTFTGGLVTLNGGNSSLGGSIQDSINMGNILVINTNANANSSFSTNTETGGVVQSYEGGIILGGIVSTITNGLSRVYDITNNGDIIGISNSFVRSGGVLGSALLYELIRAGTNINISGLSINHFSNHETNNTFISNARVSNGINYGDIQAITSTIGTYSTTASTASGQRPGINSSAGGVIGYGLTKMTRMINHGNIIATDVAGGIVGATMAYHQTSGATIIVYINTAINYGTIRAAKTNQYSNILTNRKAENVHLYPVNDTWISPLGPNSTETQRETYRRRPANKRGFGGVFGRLQRASSRYMSSEGATGSFDFVVNMDPNVDLIGRLDQVDTYTSSLSFFKFINAKYYSAKIKDNTQTVFVGEFASGVNHTISLKTGSALLTYDNYTSSGSWWAPKYYRDIRIQVPSNHEVELISTGSLTQGGTSAIKEYLYTAIHQGYDEVVQRVEITRAQYDSRSPNETITGTREIYRLVGDGKITRPVPQITENINNTNATTKFVYDEEFEMRKDSTTLDNGEPITSYIYYAEQSLLADRFQTTRPNGMYVLSTTAGSTFGSVLPRNFNVVKFQKLNKDIPNNIDYNNVKEEYISDDIPDIADYQNLLNLYHNQLYQTKLNDRSALLKDNQKVIAKDQGTNKLDLVYTNSSFTSDTIRFDVHRDMIDPNNRLINVKLLDAKIPANALIARERRNDETPLDFQMKLKTFRDNNPGVKVATGDLAPNINYGGNNLPTAGDINVGTFVSYSEAAVEDSTFTQSANYYTNYNVNINIIATTTQNPEMLGTSNINQNIITLNFRDLGNKLPSGYEIDQYIKVYFTDTTGEHEVDELYYNILSTPKNTQTFQTTIELNNKLRNGNYKIYYKFWENQEYQTREFTLALNRTHEVLDMIVESGTNFDGNIANISFGYNLPRGIINTSNGLIETINTSIPVYLNQSSYQVEFFDNLVLSDTFFEINELEITLLPNTGYYTYRVDFHLKDGSTVTNHIIEDELLPEYFKDGVNVPVINTPTPPHINETADREANQTVFSLDYNIAPEIFLNANFSVTINGDDISLVEGFTFDITNRLNIYIDKTVIPGDYSIEIFYTERSSSNIFAGLINVKKLEGKDAYLNNIEFSEFVLGIEYPEIFVVNQDNSVINTNYNPSVYFGGIDYQNADLNGVRYFRIDGEVAGTPLNKYMPPNLVNYLPLGASIQRKKYNKDGSWYLTDQVNATDSSISEIRNSLEADYTIDPNGIPNEDENIYIEYIITSESDSGNNSSNTIHYFISVRDINYSFLADFNFYYYDQTETSADFTPIDQVLKFNNVLMHLNISNYLVSKDNIELEANVNINDDLYLMNQISFDEIVRARSRLNMFYQINNETKDTYTYGLANNFSGYYHFQMDVPQGYKYEIFIGEIDENRKLPKMGTEERIKGLDGNFYYINESPRTRTRYFNIVLYNEEIEDFNWGLTDYNNTWD